MYLSPSVFSMLVWKIWAASGAVSAGQGRDTVRWLSHGLHKVKQRLQAVSRCQNEHVGVFPLVLAVVFA